MILKIRYENEMQTIVLDDRDTEKLWVSLSLEGDELAPEEKETLIRDAWEREYNRPEYNSWHKHDRHHGNPKRRTGKDGTLADVLPEEPAMDEVRDPHIFIRDEEEREREEGYEKWRLRIRGAMKPAYAEMVIAIALEGMTVGEYARSIGEADANKVSHRYRRAVRKFKKLFPRTSF